MVNTYSQIIGEKAKMKDQEIKSNVDGKPILFTFSINETNCWFKWATYGEYKEQSNVITNYKRLKIHKNRALIKLWFQYIIIEFNLTD